MLEGHLNPPWNEREDYSEDFSTFEAYAEHERLEFERERELDDYKAMTEHYLKSKLEV
jgi:hypothetical protein